MPHYLLSYLDISSDGTVIHGNCDVELPRAITTMADVEELTYALCRREPRLANPILMGFSLFAEEGTR